MSNRSQRYFLTKEAFRTSWKISWTGHFHETPALLDAIHQVSSNCTAPSVHPQLDINTR